MSGVLILAACAIVAAGASWFVYRDLLWRRCNIERGVFALALLIGAIIVALGPLCGDALTETFRPAR